MFDNLYDLKAHEAQGILPHCHTCLIPPSFKASLTVSWSKPCSHECSGLAMCMYLYIYMYAYARVRVVVNLCKMHFVWNPPTSQVSRVTCPGPLLPTIYPIMTKMVQKNTQAPAHIKMHGTSNHFHIKITHSTPLLEIEHRAYFAILLLRPPFARPEPQFPLFPELRNSPWPRPERLFTKQAIIVFEKQTILLHW